MKVTRQTNMFTNKNRVQFNLMLGAITFFCVVGIGIRRFESWRRNFNASFET